MHLPTTIKELQQSLADKKYSATELVNAYLERIAEKDKELNSFITVTQEYAAIKAKEVDDLLSSDNNAFDEKPLLGVVIALKDIFLTKGIRTTAGSKVLEDYVPQYSATVVERLENAGCIFIGKTNQDAWAHGASGENSDFGPTKNPWNTEYVPGGSSSGSAVSVAANFSTIAMGTDTGGSIRQPASFTSVVGYKPTYGAVSRYGIIAMASSLDTIGHFTRTVEDTREVLKVTKGLDNKDATLVDFDLNSQKKNYTIGIPKEFFAEGVDEEVKKSVYDAIEIYKKSGVNIKEVSLPHTKHAISVYYIIQPAEVSSNLGRYDGIRYGNKRALFGKEAKRRIMLGTYVLSAGYYDAFYLKAMKVRTLIIQEMEEIFKSVDALIAPVSPTPPFKLGEKANDPLQMYLADVLTVSANIAGIPGISIPSGFTKNKLPLAFQLMGARFSESLLFDLGELYQREISWKPAVAE